MANKHLISHVTGFNLSYPDWIRPGAFFKADGQPGALAGPPEGFSVAFGIRATPTASDSQDDPVPITDEITESLGDPPTISLPSTEFIAGTGNISNNSGWEISASPYRVVFMLGDTDLAIPLDEPNLRTDMIVLMSFVSDDAEYGGVGGTNAASLSVNGSLSEPFDAAFNYAQSELPFALGGTEDPAVGGSGGAAGGMQRSLLNSLWVTPGIPTIQEANAFFEASMQAGRVIPQRWRGFRSAANPEPELPDSPTGSFFLASDATLEIGGTWTDRISGVDLTLGGNTAGDPPQLADARFVARQANYWTSDPS